MADNDISTGSRLSSAASGQPRRLRGMYIAAGGVVFAFLPLLITLVGSIFVDDAFNEGTNGLGTLPWLTIVTLPIGAVIVVIGLVIGLVDVVRARRDAELP